MERLHKHHPHVDHARESVAGIVSQGVEDEDESKWLSFVS